MLYSNKYALILKRVDKSRRNILTKTNNKLTEYLVLISTQTQNPQHYKYKQNRTNKNYKITMFPPRPRANAPPPPPPPQQNNQQQNQYGGRRQQQQLVIPRLPDPPELVQLIVQTGTRFVKRNKIISSSYLIGIIVLLYVTIYGGRQLTINEEIKYNKIMNTIDLQLEYDAHNNYLSKKYLYQQSQGWFWNCNRSCQNYKQQMQIAQQRLTIIRAEGNARMSDAKAIAGLSSDIAINEIKDSFFTYFTSGKQYAKRQSMWDIMFIGIRSMTRSRDESTIEFIIKVLVQVLLNFSIGLIMAVVLFIIGLYNIIITYQSNPIIAFFVFILASLAGLSFVISYLFAIYGAAATGVYGLAKLAETSTRAQIANNQRQNIRQHYD